MASRRDQLQSYQFLNQRIISAFVMRETDPAQSPLRRGVGAVFAGIMVAVMVAAGFGVYGLLTKVGSDTWKTNGAVIIEKDTGASFVYQDGVLHPMLNYASALLATSTSTRAVFQEPAKALNGVPRGVMLGIPNAPDSIPAAGDLVGAPWTLCSASASGAADFIGPSTLLALSVEPSGARRLGDLGLLVRDPGSDSTYLLWHGARFSVSADVISALFGAVTPIPVGTALINGLPSGADIAPIAIRNSGSPSSAVSGASIGQLLVTQIGSGGNQFWLVFDDGIAPITELQKDIAVSQGAADPRQISAADANAIPHSTQLGSGSKIAQPQRPPTLATPQSPTDPVCAVYPNATNPPTISLGGTMPGGGTPTGSRTQDGVVLVDQVEVPAGHGAVVVVLASGTVPSGGYCLVTDLGIRYSIASADTLAALGYTGGVAVAMPANLLQLIPSGPALDPAAATAAIAPGGGG